MDRIEEIGARTAKVMADLTVEGMKAGLGFADAYKEARAYMVGRWPHLAQVIPVDPTK